jgi:hypothetical protein
VNETRPAFLSDRLFAIENEKEPQPKGFDDAEAKLGLFDRSHLDLFDGRYMVLLQK